MSSPCCPLLGGAADSPKASSAAEPQEFSKANLREAQAYSVAWLHYLLRTVPVAFAVRYLDPEVGKPHPHPALDVYWKNRVKYTTLRFVFFGVLLTLLPWGMSCALVNYPCVDTKGEMTIQSGAAPDRNTTEKVNFKPTECKVQDVMRSKWVLLSFPTACLLLIVVTFFVFLCGCYPWMRKTMYKYIVPSAPSLAYNGLGTRWTRRGTNTISLKTLAKGTRIEKEISVWHDILGAPDVVYLSTLFTLATCLAVVIPPLFVARMYNNLGSGAGIALAILYPYLKLALKMSEFVFGGSGAVMIGVQAELSHRPSIKIMTWDEARERAVKLLDDQSKILPKRHQDVVQDLARKIEVGFKFSDELTQQAESREPPTGISHLLDGARGGALALSTDQLEAYSSVNRVGIVLYLYDPGFDKLACLDFQSQLFLNSIYLWDCKEQLQERSGRWELPAPRATIV